MVACDTVTVLIATVFIVAGSSLLWAAVDVSLTGDVRSATQYETTIFTFSTVVAWVHHVTPERDLQWRMAWRFLFYGLLYYGAVASWNNWATVDLNRQLASNEEQAGQFGISDVKKAFGGEIFAYMGQYLLLWNFRGRIRVARNVGVALFLIAVVLNIIGTGILMDLDQVQVSAGSTDRKIAFDIVTSQWITLIILSGSVFHESLDGAHAAVMGVGYFGVSFLSNGFMLNADNTGEQAQKAWAGSLFCMFSAIVTLLCALLIPDPKPEEPQDDAVGEGAKQK